MCSRVCRVSALGALLVCVAALAPGSLDDKRAEIAPAPFVLGSRYGRSSSPPLRMMAPRNDRFFMGSRYGKRSEPAVVMARVEGGGGSGGGAGPGRMLLCSFTGLTPLYRCSPGRHRLEGNSRKPDEGPFLENSGDDE